MKILVTGAAGFIGHHFVGYLLRHTDWEVVCLDRLDPAGDLARLAAVLRDQPEARQRVRVVHHDLRATIEGQLSDETPFDHVVHMAAGSHVDRSVVDPVGFVLDNVVGTAHLLDFFRKNNALRHGGKILYFSTDEVFGPANMPTDGDAIGIPGFVFKHGGYAPWDRFNPNNPYAASKAGGECLCTAYANTYGLPILVTHCTNVFGERQHREKFIPLLIERVRRGEKILIHAKSQIPSSRYYVYVDNVSSAVLHLLQNGMCLNGGDSLGKYNISGGREYSNLFVAQEVAQLLEKPLVYEFADFVAGRPRHDMRYAVDDSSLRGLGWVPTVTFEEGLSRVVRNS